MHCVRFTLTFLLCLPAIGCQTIPQAVPDAEAVVMEHPDSAVRLLLGIPDPAKNLSRSNYARYALISTQARWLAGENMIGDTLSDAALGYYSSHTKDFVRTYKAYYYAAKIANLRHQPEIAMSLLLNSRKALPAAGEWERHYVVETWLGVFCGQQRLFEEKVHHAMRAYVYADSLDRDGWRCISLGDIAHAYMGLEKYDSMEYYALRALRLAEEKGITENTSQKWAMLIENALRQKDYAAAEEYWAKGYKYADNRARYSWLKTRAEIYNRRGNYDMALRMIDSSRLMCPDTSDLTARALWAFNASAAFEGLGQAKKSLDALKYYCSLKDSIEDNIHGAEVLHIRELWQYEQLKAQNTALQGQKQLRERLVYQTILACGAILLAGAWLGMRIWHRTKLRELVQQKRILRQANELDEMRRKEEQLRTAFFRQLNSHFITQVKQGADAKKCRMSDDDWRTIYTHADAVFDNFTARLRHRFPSLNEEDIRYCCMVRMHLSQAEIAGVVCLEKDSVKKRLKRIRTEKLASAKGTTLEDVLSKL